MLSLAPSLRRNVCLRCQLRQTLWTLQRSRLPHAVLAANGTSRLDATPSLRRLRRFTTQTVWKQTQAGEAEDQEAVGGFTYGAAGGSELWPDTGNPADVNALDDISRLRARRQLTVGAHMSRPDVKNKRRKDRRGFDKALKDTIAQIPLGIDMLEAPGGIIRLAQGADKRHLRAQELASEKQRIEDLLQEAKALDAWNSPVDVLASLEVENAKIQDGEIIESVDTVRDRWLSGMDPNAIPTQKQCAEVFEKLNQSFTKGQLKKYSDATATDEADDFDDLQGVFEDAFCRRSKWYPGRTPFGKAYTSYVSARESPPNRWALDRPDPKKALASTRARYPPGSKQGLVETILRTSWRLRCLEEVAGVGEMDVSLNPGHLSFLQSRYDLARQFAIQFQVKLRFASNVVRMRGEHANCGSAFAALYAAVRTIRTERLSLSREIVAPSQDGVGRVGQERLWQSQFLDELGGLTKSHIHKITNETGDITDFDVTFLAPQKAGQQDMSIYTDVCRLIDDITSDQSNYSDVRVVGERRTCHQVPFQSDATLPMHERGAAWHRFRADSTGGQAVEQNQDLDLDSDKSSDVGSSLLGMWRRLFAKREHAADRAHRNWDSVTTPSLVVRAGQLVFNDPLKEEPLQLRDPNARDAAAWSKQWSAKLQKFSESRRRAFVASLPSAMSLFEDINESDLLEEQRIVITLKPSHTIRSNTDMQKDAMASLPDLRIELASETDDDGAAVVLDARLVNRIPSVQVMMPSEDFDLQLTSKNSLQAKLQALNPNLRRYVNQVVITNGRLEERSVEPNLELIIPELALHMCHRTAYESSRFEFLTRPRQESEHIGHDGRFLDNPTASDLILPSPESPDATSLNSIGSSSTPYANDFNTSLGNDDSPLGFNDTYQDSFTDYSEDDDIDFDTPAGKQLKVPAGSVLLNYRVGSIEHHSRLHGRLHGFPLTYSIVDGGALGGQYEELALHARATQEGGIGLFDAPVVDRVGYEEVERDVSKEEDGVGTEKKEMVWFKEFFKAALVMVRPGERGNKLTEGKEAGVDESTTAR